MAMNPEIESLFHEYLGMGGCDATSAAILTLADVMMAQAGGTALVPATPVTAGHLLSIGEAAKRLNLTSRMIYMMCLSGELHPTRIDRALFIAVHEIERFEGAR
jgi:hypothetical protein